jgi:hypothetical protein
MAPVISMNRIIFRLVAAAAIATIVACSDSTGTKSVEPIALQPLANRYPELNDNGHVMKLKADGKKDADDAQEEAKNAAKAKPSQGTGISYHGGPVLQSRTNVVAVYWSASTIYTNGPTPGTVGSGTQDHSLVGYFLSHLGGSSYFNINSTYTDGSGAPIANVVNYTGFWANNTNAPSGTTKISDTQMIGMLQSGFNNGSLVYDPSAIYAIFTSGKVNLGGGFGSSYCAYHSYATVTIAGVSRTILYAAMPYDQAYPGVCTEGTAAPNADPGADSEVNTLAHEIEESTTDPLLNAWYDRRGYENADKCAWTWGATYHTSSGGVANIKIGSLDFLVQQNWLNVGSGGCAKAYP